MASLIHHVNNTQIFKCSMCDNNMSNGIMRDGLYYCDTNCYQNKMFFDDLSHPNNTFQTQQYISRPQTNTPTQIRPQSRTQPRTQTQPQNNDRHYGTCANCQNHYDYKVNCVDTGDNWFCSRSCSTIFVSGRNVAYPTSMFPFASNMRTVFPLAINASAGKLYF